MPGAGPGRPATLNRLKRLVRAASYLVKRAIAGIDRKTGLVSLLLTPYIARRLRNAGLREVLDILFSDSLIGMLYKPMQIREELEEFLDLIKSKYPEGPKRVLEVGTAYGGTLLVWTRVCSDDAVIVSIDLPGGPFGGGYPPLRKLIYRRFARGRQKIVLIRGDSHDLKVLNTVRRIFGNSGADMLFIDGDHSYEGVARDFKWYGSLVRDGGVIALHDIADGPPKNVGGVPKFWRALVEGLEGLGLSRAGVADVKEIVRGGARGYGIGVLVVRRMSKVSVITPTPPSTASLRVEASLPH